MIGHDELALSLLCDYNWLFLLL